MTPSRGDTKDRLMTAYVRLAVENGLRAATIRAVAKEVGLTEGAIYRHYTSKEELRWEAYKRTIEQMVAEKEPLANGTGPIQKRIHRWVELTFESYDRHPLAFTYVLLTPHPPFDAHNQDEILTRQGRIFIQMYEQARDNKQVRPLEPALALCHFTGLMLNPPRLINDGVLKGPATNYTADVTEAIWSVLKPVSRRGGTTT